MAIYRGQRNRVTAEVLCRLNQNGWDSV